MATTRFDERATLNQVTDKRSVQSGHGGRIGFARVHGNPSKTGNKRARVLTTSTPASGGVPFSSPRQSHIPSTSRSSVVGRVVEEPQFRPPSRERGGSRGWDNRKFSASDIVDSEPEGTEW